MYNRCIGTRYCANACPYNVRFFNFGNPVWERPLELQLNPGRFGARNRSHGKVHVLRAAYQCRERSAKAENRELKDGEIKPACVQSCPANALVFGDLNDPESEVSRLSRSSRGTKLLEDLNATEGHISPEAMTDVLYGLWYRTEISSRSLRPLHAPGLFYLRLRFSGHRSDRRQRMAISDVNGLAVDRHQLADFLGVLHHEFRLSGSASATRARSSRRSCAS